MPSKLHNSTQFRSVAHHRRSLELHTRDNLFSLSKSCIGLRPLPANLLHLLAHLNQLKYYKTPIDILVNSKELLHLITDTVLVLQALEISSL